MVLRDRKAAAHDSRRIGYNRTKLKKELKGTARHVELNENFTSTQQNETELKEELGQTARHGAHPAENLTRTHGEPARDFKEAEGLMC